MFPAYLWLLTRVLSTIAHAAAGALGTRPSLRPLISRGQEFKHHPGASARGIARPCLHAAGRLKFESRILSRAIAKSAAFCFAEPVVGSWRQIGAAVVNPAVTSFVYALPTISPAHLHGFSAGE